MASERFHKLFNLPDEEKMVGTLYKLMNGFDRYGQSGFVMLLWVLMAMLMCVDDLLSVVPSASCDKSLVKYNERLKPTHICSWISNAE